MDYYAHKINQLARTFKKKLNEGISQHGLFASQWPIIIYLVEHKICTQVELSHYLNIEAPSITRTIGRMELEGLISRQEGEDRRVRHIRLTDKALELYPVLKMTADQIEANALRDLDPQELEIFSRVLKKMTHNLI
jgi:DNA-binding MarR family transcriptional regulator